MSNSQMLIMCGRNKFSQLGEESNNKNMNGDQIICPFINSKYDCSLISSYSTYEDRTIVITKNGELLALGNNTDRLISQLLPNRILKNFTKFGIGGKDEPNFYPISAVCGSKYLLYLLSESKENTSKRRLFYTNIGKSYISKKSLFLDIGNSNPVSLFGGHSNAAAISEDGSVIFINDSHVEVNSLPGEDKATSVACCVNSIFVVGSNCKVYASKVEKSETKLNFKLVEELEGKNIIEVNGTFNHCFAVSKDGKVFGYGSNQYGELGINEESLKDLKEFKEIVSLNNYKIQAAYAGFDHSLFKTESGKILACGSNYNGQLINGEQCEDFVYLPIETDVEKGATFCVAGFGFSSVFLGYDPSNSPNRRVIQRVTIKEDEELIKAKLSRALAQLSKAEEEIKRLKQENSKLHDENGLLREKIKKMESKTETEKVQKTDSKSFELELFEPEAMDNLKVVKTIGRGESSEVFEVAKEQHLALKVLDISSVDKNESSESESLKKLQRFQNEYQSMMNLNHPNIARAFGFCFGDKNHAPSILLQFYSHNLRDFIDQMNDIQKVCAIYEISLAMEIIHASNLIHRNLKPENILIDEKCHIKLSDFCISILANDDVKSSKLLNASTLVYMAPELLTKSPIYSNKVDVYSFGILVYYILTGGKVPKVSVGEVINPKKFQLPKNINKISRDLIVHCWFASPKERPSFAQIVSFIKSNKFKLIDGVEKNFADINEFLSI